MDFGVGSVFSGINAAFIFADFISKLNDVPEEARRFSTLIHRVRLDYYEALRLISHESVRSRFTKEPKSREYVYGTIKAVKSALADIGHFVERIRVQDESGKGTVTLSRKLEWLWKYRSKVDSSEKVLDTSHKSMLSAIHRMEIWITMDQSAAFSSSLSPPTYHEAVMSQKSGCRNDKRADENDETTCIIFPESKSHFKVNELIISAEEDEVADSKPAMSTRVYDPVDTEYTSPSRNIQSDVPSYSLRRRQDAQRLRAEYVLPRNVDPFPEFNDISRSVMARSSMLSLRSEYAQFSTLLPEPRPAKPPFQTQESTGPVRASSERSTNRHAGSNSARSRSVMSERRELRRAGMLLASGGYDATHGL
ncbi:uncharacterized protein PV09_07065 [Verruconis gallopava]|uniref:Uncharacterized protein n=1 Tax=Verruconis gallopava TaxID=253628 RepID=A0A0D2A477_9PEZI|nr:uncharacterized protein PV09_07065 [Verruconis gallopava]KIW01593.1 hypothetical protein PV09_07065 [Verruconis gallopava]